MQLSIRSKVMKIVVLDFVCGSSGCVLWLCVAVVCCGCVFVVWRLGLAFEDDAEDEEEDAS